EIQTWLDSPNLTTSNSAAAERRVNSMTDAERSRHLEDQKGLYEIWFHVLDGVVGRLQVGPTASRDSLTIDEVEWLKIQEYIIHLQINGVAQTADFVSPVLGGVNKQTLKAQLVEFLRVQKKADLTKLNERKGVETRADEIINILSNSVDRINN
ncbi:MAG: hypothetical protein HQL13_05615, partial [Candidatus Omnitrophica bacterium]|nr:hypothetical protein [Candidatus Omnitrophota bacterium]